MKARPRLLFLITEDWYFWSHRLDLARAAAESGFDVSIATRVPISRTIQREGFRLFPISLFAENHSEIACLEVENIVERPVIVTTWLKPVCTDRLVDFRCPCRRHPFWLRYFTERRDEGL
jgi:hypothetical protein